MAGKAFAPELQLDDSHAPLLHQAPGTPIAGLLDFAAAGKSYLVERGVQASDVIALGEGRDTFESLTAAAQEMEERGWCTATLVSDPWHMLRSRTMATDLGIDAVTSPTRTGPTVRLALSGRYILRETAAQLAYLGLTARTVTPIVTTCG